MGIMKPIRIVLADDHNLMRSDLKALLSGMPGVEVVAEATKWQGSRRDGELDES